MNSPKPDPLEHFVERHRADFDSQEPSPDLWAALELRLAAETPPPARPLMQLADPAKHARPPAAADADAARAGWWQRYGVAAALVLLVLAAGASEAWKARHPAPALVAAAILPASVTAGPDAALYQSGYPMAMTAIERSTGADSQLVRAVRGMEAYYTNQLARRQTELHQLVGPGLAGPTGDWQRELVALDSSYRKLKMELPHHPQPDAVLTAMNRNLQIRLDILDKQLHFGTAPAADPNSGTYVLADSQRHH